MFPWITVLALHPYKSYFILNAPLAARHYLSSNIIHCLINALLPYIGRCPGHLQYRQRLLGSPIFPVWKRTGLEGCLLWARPMYWVSFSFNIYCVKPTFAKALHRIRFSSHVNIHVNRHTLSLTLLNGFLIPGHATFPVMTRSRSVGILSTNLICAARLHTYFVYVYTRHSGNK